MLFRNKKSKIRNALFIMSSKGRNAHKFTKADKLFLLSVLEALMKLKISKSRKY